MANVLHFFPKSKVIVWAEGGTEKLRAEAWGGEIPDPNVRYAVMKPRQTTAGKYVIHSVEPYRTATWEWSRIAWGTPLKLSPDGKHVLYQTGVAAGAWSSVENKIAVATPATIAEYYYQLYGVRQIPNQWVFNDFGVKAVRYYKDANHNKVLDKGESLSGEMIHTTPTDEANTFLGNPVQLQSSHGCIHLKPLDRDAFEAIGAFKRGTDFIVHGYSEDVSTVFP